jgi:TonB family protein
MALRCLLFSSDEGTANPILQVLAGLGVEGEHCSDAVSTVDKLAQQNYQIVILDWDQQPEASLLLTAARERKAAERPLTLAIVSNDLSVPQALQAGANSILRKPIMVNQVKDTLTTARDLLRSKQDSAANAAHAAAAGASAGSAATTLPANPASPTLRAGEFLQSAGTAPGGEFVTGSEVHESLAPPPAEPVDPLSDLEPMAASMSSVVPMTTSVTEEKPVPVQPAASFPPPAPGEVRGLEWFLKARAAAMAPSPAPASAPPTSSKAELLGFDEAVPYSPPPPKTSDDFGHGSAPEHKPSAHAVEEYTHEQTPEQKQEQKKEAQLFAHIAGESSESEATPRPPSRFKRPIIGALLLASMAIVAAPQAPWHPKIGEAWVHGRQSLHAWLNPTLVTTPQAPVAHEDFGRAGDEYKLPVTENIPDATTDPSQIRVVPVVDPTVKKSNPEGGNALQPPTDGDGTGATPVDSPPAPGNPTGAQPGAQGPDNQVPAQPPVVVPATAPPATAPAAVGMSASPSSSGSSPVAVPVVVAAQPHSDPPPTVSTSISPVSSNVAQPLPPKNQPPHYATPPSNVPSSLKSQMASMTPDASGNKLPESAMQSIEPVSVPELTERTLMTDQPALDYPAAAGGQSGTVILQVLIGRDGTVQDAKFLQGSLAFAKSAIAGVKLWKFKPYIMNGRPVSVQTSLTINFKP